ncbi:hypothetical protein [Mesorhizobium sp.]|uniref:hypothetical protein n=1 Tax=Mesorhizobium sp. TaxID=1871066 RepID=UPI000FEA6858|nr:hypothetical protein [Mesorhizobium sp.]RWM29142.1 MAG: hypothetical protein EOR75_32485 [Mesorhizobium sp.]TIO74309.1 MAG: hypothetical protein E5X75_24655 [Mesorhizobium sp.]TIO82154.1 MAG: hypothetical protein E5X74_25725 [Mesorhizobium sp.]TJV49199.1 MAG: hypothetical protein E5Y01_24970 [Mesorhizobium sp.]
MFDGGTLRRHGPHVPLAAMAVEWTITIEGKNEFGDICRREMTITKSWEGMFDGDIGMSIDDGKKIMAGLQGAATRSNE